MTGDLFGHAQRETVAAGALLLRGRALGRDEPLLAAIAAIAAMSTVGTKLSGAFSKVGNSL